MAVNSFPSIAQILGNRVALAIQHMSQNLEEKNERGWNHIASNSLNQSIDFNVKIFGTKVEVNIVMEDYWKSLDQGQKPGNRPQLNAILKWMAFKGIDAKSSIRQNKTIRSYKGGLKKKVKGLLVTRNREQIAKRIIEKIYRVGTKPTYFSSSVINDQWQAEVGEQLRAAGATDIRFSLNVPIETRI